MPDYYEVDFMGDEGVPAEDGWVWLGEARVRKVASDWKYSIQQSKDSSDKQPAEKVRSAVVEALNIVKYVM